MLYLLDTNAVSDLIREDACVLARLGLVRADDEIVISPTVRAEILFGIERLPAGRRRDELREKVMGTLDRLACVPIPPEAADRFAVLKCDSMKSGHALEDHDLLIAATASSLGGVVVTRDGDFSRLSNLRTEDWSR